jgi:hypothetical protein
MARPSRLLQSIAFAGSLAGALSCHALTDPQFPGGDLRLASELGERRDFFEGEPIYVAFSLSNHGADTAWTAIFSFTSWSLNGELTDSAGHALETWGLIADYFYGPGYRGDPLPPGATRYQVVLIQNRWGQYRSDMDTLYGGHHLPPGRYTLRMHFPFDPPRCGTAAHFMVDLLTCKVSRVVDANPITFRVHARDSVEEESFQRLRYLAGMTWDKARQPAFGDSLLSNLSTRVANDPVRPMLTGWFLGDAWFFGVMADSSKADAIRNAMIETARAQRATAGGAMAVVEVHEERPTALPSLAQELTGSMAGAVATSLLRSLTGGASHHGVEFQQTAIRERP